MRTIRQLAAREAALVAELEKVRAAMAWTAPVDPPKRTPRRKTASG